GAAFPRSSMRFMESARDLLFSFGIKTTSFSRARQSETNVAVVNGRRTHVAPQRTADDARRGIPTSATVHPHACRLAVLAPVQRVVRVGPVNGRCPFKHVARHVIAVENASSARKNPDGSRPEHPLDEAVAVVRLPAVPPRVCLGGVALGGSLP